MNDPTQSPQEPGAGASAAPEPPGGTGTTESATGNPAPIPGDTVTGDTRDTEATEREPEREPEFYCPACGRRYKYPKECAGTPALPHAPVEVVNTDELEGDPGEHTPAPAGE